MISLNYKKAVIYCLFVILTLSSKAQLNMVPDASFEDTTNTVTGWGQTSLRQWRNLDSNKLNAIPFGYFSYVTQNLSFSLPDNQWCFQHPRSGGGLHYWIFIGEIVHPGSGRLLE